MVPTADCLTALFEWFHSHPELAYEERETTAKIRDVLEDAGIPILDSGLETGLIAVIEGGQPGPVIGLRADIDALPVQEESGLPYASCHPGRMHACGHDFHTVMLLGTALLLKEKQADLPGTVKLIFQPAEEIDSGARRVIATGLLDDCALFLAGHSYPQFEAGTLGVKEGPVMAAVDRFEVIVRGRGCHAGQPAKGVDPIVVQAAVVESLQTVVSRNMDPFTPRVVSITRVEAGTTWNVIPETARLEGTVRTLNADQRALAEERFRSLVTGIAAAYGAEAEIRWTHGSGAVINDEKLCILARETAREMGLAVARQEDTMGGEDFSCYLEKRPGLFVRVGTGGSYPGHHPKFTVDPAALEPAARFFAMLAQRCLMDIPPSYFKEEDLS